MKAATRVGLLDRSESRVLGSAVFIGFVVVVVVNMGAGLMKGVVMLGGLAAEPAGGVYLNRFFSQHKKMDVLPSLIISAFSHLWFPDGSVGILLLQQIKNWTRWVESGGVAEANGSCAAARIVEKVWNGIGGCVCGNGQRRRAVAAALAETRRLCLWQWHWQWQRHWRRLAVAAALVVTGSGGARQQDGQRRWPEKVEMGIYCNGA